MSLFSSTALSGKHILVTGASGGIGREITKIVLSMGASVTASGRNIEKLTNLKDELPGKNIRIVPADITNEMDRKKLITESITMHGPLYGLVNSAATIGSFGQDTMTTLQEKELTRIMHTNLTATILLSQLAYNQMLPQQEGAIVNISSLSGLRGVKGNIPYVSSKFALIGFTQSFALEASGHGIRVNAVCPGYVDTEMGYNAILNQGQTTGKTYEEQRKFIESTMPSGQITHPTEVASATAFLLTNAAPNIIGESIKISGGLYV